MKAVDKFEYRRGTNFQLMQLDQATITRSIATNRTIRIPVHMIETINKIVEHKDKS